MKNLKTFILTIAMVTIPCILPAQNAQKGLKYTEASTLTLTGKLMTNTPNPYHRVDTVRYKGFTAHENFQVRQSAGIAVAFRTNSTRIAVRTKYGAIGSPRDNNWISARGYDLYIRKDGKWLFAAANVLQDPRKEEDLMLMPKMDAVMHDCLLYLPEQSEEYSILIGTDEGSTIEALENPFKHRIGIFGSSFTHGASISRSGMAYPSQLARNTGWELLNLGCSGNCKLQSYFADVLCDAQVEAFIFDSFSNPSIEMIKERLFPFIEKLQAAHPGIPLIFQRTIRRESRNFCTSSEQGEASRIAVADSMMNIATKKYKDVYYIYPNATMPSHNGTVDGTHPDNYGYTLWAQSIEKPLRKILKKYFKD